MTEKKGGSDVAGGCDTYAKHIEGDKVAMLCDCVFFVGMDCNSKLLYR